MLPCLACFVIDVLRAFHFNFTWPNTLYSFSCKSSCTQYAICSSASFTIISLLSPGPCHSNFCNDTLWWVCKRYQCPQVSFECERGGTGHWDSTESCVDEIANARTWTAWPRKIDAARNPFLKAAWDHCISNLCLTQDWEEARKLAQNRPVLRPFDRQSSRSMIMG